MIIDSLFLDKYNVQGPRYTSYPPANFFHTNVDEAKYTAELIASNQQKPENISLYIHIPFCPIRCHFCGCNTVIGKGKSVIRRYIDAVKTEIKAVSQHLDLSRPVSQIHWGGGTPNSIPMSYIREIMDLIKETYVFTENPEIAMECSPAYLDYKDVDELADMGFNRLSLGIQDFRDDVLEIINRHAPKHPVKDMVAYLREKGFKGINLDFVYGLPLQTPESFKKTLEQAIEIQPDRIVTFSYAHVPWVKVAQKKLEEVGLPGPEDKIAMLINSIEQMQEAGYTSIGIDHFSKPEDELAKAYDNKMLHRNFQGYCTLETTGQVYGFGASSISQLWGGYIQNYKEIGAYLKSVEETGFAVDRGYLLNEQEQIVRAVINSIMCNGLLVFEDMAQSFGISVQELKEVIKFDASKFAEFEKDGIIELTNESILLSDKGRMIARNIAMALDPNLKAGETIYSKTL